MNNNQIREYCQQKIENWHGLSLEDVAEILNTTYSKVFDLYREEDDEEILNWCQKEVETELCYADKLHIKEYCDQLRDTLRRINVTLRYYRDCDNPLSKYNFETKKIEKKYGDGYKKPKVLDLF